MHTKGLIDTELDVYTGVKSTDAENAARRIKLLHFGQRSVNSLCRKDEWSWLRKTATLTIAAGDTYELLPADFSRFSSQGGVYDTTQRKKLEEKQLTELQEMIVEDPSLTLEKSLMFAQAGIDTTSKQLKIRFAASTGNSLLVSYIGCPPTLVDNDGVAVACGLEGIPLEYHDAVLMGTVWRSRRNLNDDRWRQFQEEYEDELRQLRINDRQLRTGAQYLPDTTEGQW